ncbi:ATP-grasp domain-containing protein [Saccharopolyspora sp. NPDC000359]|uniref:ATP-grasp domain-containing protein n=1 Tax=Saccharopolyspora sp. NPDC000359 TaxID=3154251 RepID=UPI003319705E
MAETRNIFVLGPDERNFALLRQLEQRTDYRFHSLLDEETLMHGDHPLSDHLDAAQRRLDSFDGSVDAIVGYWDFPVSSMVPILCTENGLPGPSLEAVVKCEHKYWSRLEQRKVTDAHPGFDLIDFDDPQPPPGLSFPMWLKPVKSYSSDLAFKVEDEAGLVEATAEIRAGIGRVGQAFDFLLSRLELPPEIAEAGGQACLAEEAVSGVQLTAEGYCSDGEPHVYGVVDSLCYPDSPSFLRYQYPSELPAEVQDRVISTAAAVIRQIGLDSSMFNIEFFWNADQDKLYILEINPRLSQSHAPLFQFVDGAPNYECMVRLALGEEPDMPRRQGQHAVAAKWFHRSFTDAFVRTAPTAEQVDQLRQEAPEAIIDLVAEEGQRLSELPAQDSYSYELFAAYLGARDTDELTAKYHRCVAGLPFTLV